MDKPARAFRIEEHLETPTLSVLFGWGPMMPFAVGAVASWLLQPNSLAIRLTLLYGGAILAFLSGVRRGLSFRTPGGPHWQQIATMIWLFLLAMTALVANAIPAVAIPSLAVGYVSIAVLDPIAARHEEAPLFFGRLRPVQMVIPIVSLFVIWAKVIMGIAHN